MPWIHKSELPFNERYPNWNKENKGYSIFIDCVFIFIFVFPFILHHLGYK